MFALSLIFVCVLYCPGMVIVLVRFKPGLVGGTSEVQTRSCWGNKDVLN